MKTRAFFQIRNAHPIHTGDVALAFDQMVLVPLGKGDTAFSADGLIHVWDLDVLDKLPELQERIRTFKMYVAKDKNPDPLVPGDYRHFASPNVEVRGVIATKDRSGAHIVEVNRFGDSTVRYRNYAEEFRPRPGRRRWSLCGAIRRLWRSK